MKEVYNAHPHIWMAESVLILVSFKIRHMTQTRKFGLYWAPCIEDHSFREKSNLAVFVHKNELQTAVV